MKLQLIFKQIFSCLQAKRKVVPFFDRSENETVNIGGVDWAVRNAGTDEENPQGKLYTIEQAMLLENKRRRLPTLEEGEKFEKKDISDINYFHHTQTAIKCISDPKQLQTIYCNNLSEHNTVYQRIMAYVQ